MLWWATESIAAAPPNRGEEEFTVLPSDAPMISYTGVTATDIGVRYIYPVKAIRVGERSEWSRYAAVILPASRPTLVSNLGRSPSATAEITQQYATGFALSKHGQGCDISSVMIDLAAVRSDLTVLAENSAATGAPTICGTPQVGEGLTANTVGISDGNGLPGDAQGFDYQWQRSDDGNAWIEIAGANAPDYYPTDGDADKYIRVWVSFEAADEFHEGPLTGAATGAVVHGPR